MTRLYDRNNLYLLELYIPYVNLDSNHVDRKRRIDNFVIDVDLCGLVRARIARNHVSCLDDNHLLNNCDDECAHCATTQDGPHKQYRFDQGTFVLVRNDPAAFLAQIERRPIAFFMHDDDVDDEKLQIGRAELKLDADSFRLERKRTFYEDLPSAVSSRALLVRDADTGRPIGNFTFLVRTICIEAKLAYCDVLDTIGGLFADAKSCTTCDALSTENRDKWPIDEVSSSSRFSSQNERKRTATLTYRAADKTAELGGPENGNTAKKNQSNPKMMASNFLKNAKIVMISGDFEMCTNCNGGVVQKKKDGKPIVPKRFNNNNDHANKHQGRVASKKLLK